MMVLNSDIICEKILLDLWIRITLPKTKDIHNRICALEASLKEHGIFSSFLWMIFISYTSIGKPVISELFHIAGAAHSLHRFGQ